MRMGLTVASDVDPVTVGDCEAPVSSSLPPVRSGSAVAECHFQPALVSSSSSLVSLLEVADCHVCGDMVSEEGSGGLVREVDSSMIFHDGGGMVSEEVVVKPTARAALRPQPTDGLRQPPLLTVEPAVVVRSGLGELYAAGQPGCGVFNLGIRSFASVANPRAATQLQHPPTVSSSHRVGTVSTPDRSLPILDDQGWQQSLSRRGRASAGSSR
ncbi:hypothetical protein Dimus_037643, partial [Dionaea muscipula]